MKDKVRVGVIGAGVWGENVIWSYSCNPFVELAAIADLDGDRAREIAGKYGAGKVYTDYRAMLDGERLDIASVATPDFLHRKVVEDCAARKVNILLEKPVATTMEDCGAIRAAIEDAGVKFMTNYFMRWIPQFVEVRAAIANGDLGEIVNGFAKIDDVVTVPTRMLKWSKSSSPIFFIMIHNIDIVRWLIGSEAKEVYAKNRRGFLSGMGCDTDDSVMAMVAFANGATMQFEANWILPRSFNGLNDHDVRIVGTRGVAYIDLTNQGTTIFVDRDLAPFEHPNKATVFANNLHGQIAGCVRLSVAHFVDCVRKDESPIISIQDAVEPTRIACAVAESLKKGTVVKL